MRKALIAFLLLALLLTACDFFSSDYTITILSRRSDIIAVDWDGESKGEIPWGTKKIEFTTSGGDHRLEVWSCSIHGNTLILEETVYVDSDMTITIE